MLPASQMITIQIFARVMPGMPEQEQLPTLVRMNSTESAMTFPDPVFLTPPWLTAVLPTEPSQLPLPMPQVFPRRVVWCREFIIRKMQALTSRNPVCLLQVLQPAVPGHSPSLEAMLE